MSTDNPRQETGTSQVETFLFADLREEFLQEAQEAYDARQSGQPRGPLTGFSALDEVTGGFLAPGVHILQAAPGAGKTAFCLQVAAECAFPCLYVTAEMPRVELVRRIISRTTNTFLGKLRNGEKNPDEVKALFERAARKTPMLAIMDATRAVASARDHILPNGENLRKRFQAQSLLLVIDSLQVWAHGVGMGESEYERVTLAQQWASWLASHLSCPVLCVSHRNRPGQKEGGLHASKGSGDIEYAAETLMELEMEEPEPGNPDVRPVKVGVHKNRHGRAGVAVPLEFEGRVQSFREASGLATGVDAAPAGRMSMSFNLKPNGGNGR